MHTSTNRFLHCHGPFVVCYSWAIFEAFIWWVYMPHLSRLRSHGVLDINILSSKVGDALRKARESMAEAETHMAFIMQLSEELVDGNPLPSFVHLNTSEPDPVWMPVQSLQHDVFQGRLDKLSEIEKYFAEAVHNDAPGPLVAMIYGMGGVGKTTLATEYYRKWQFKSRYRYGLWVNAETKASIAESFHEIARALDLQIHNEQDAQLSVLTWLNSEGSGPSPAENPC
jgi:NB-ARC domain